MSAIASTMTDDDEGGKRYPLHLADGHRPHDPRRDGWLEFVGNPEKIRGKQEILLPIIEKYGQVDDRGVADYGPIKRAYRQIDEDAQMGYVRQLIAKYFVVHPPLDRHEEIFGVEIVEDKDEFANEHWERGIKKGFELCKTVMDDDEE